MIRLSKEQIEDILSVIEPNPNIPQKTAMSIVSGIRKSLEKSLSTTEIYPEVIQELKDSLRHEYNNTLIQPGECVGVLCAQDIGERQTQATLKTFHKAGSSDKQVDSVSKFSELLNATRKPKQLCSYIYFNSGNSSIEELRETIGKSIVQVYMKDIVSEWTVMMQSDIDSEEPKDWYNPFLTLFPDRMNPGYSDGLSVKINMDKLYEYKIRLEDVADSIEELYSDSYCMFSPDNIGEIDIYLDTNTISVGKKIAFITDENVVTVYLEEVAQRELENIIIAGISGIDEMYFMKEPQSRNSDSKWMIETSGSNLKEILSNPIVDKTRTRSSNLWDIHELLGIEATRQFMIDEFASVMEGINMCHITLLVDRMTYLGTISSVSRYTMRTDESGPMGKASFEETLDNFLKAGVYGQIEPARGVSSSIICGKKANMGTGLCELRMDLPKLDMISE